MSHKLTITIGVLVALLITDLAYLDSGFGFPVLHTVAHGAVAVAPYVRSAAMSALIGTVYMVGGLSLVGGVCVAWVGLPNTLRYGARILRTMARLATDPRLPRWLRAVYSVMLVAIHALPGPVDDTLMIVPLIVIIVFYRPVLVSVWHGTGTSQRTRPMGTGRIVAGTVTTLAAASIALVVAVGWATLVALTVHVVSLDTVAVRTAAGWLVGYWHALAVSDTADCLTAAACAVACLAAFLTAGRA